MNYKYVYKRYRSLPFRDGYLDTVDFLTITTTLEPTEENISIISEEHKDVLKEYFLLRCEVVLYR